MRIAGVCAWTGLILLLSCGSDVGGQEDGPVPIFMLDAYKGAKCLDGTQGAMYYQAAKNPDMKNMWIIHLQGEVLPLEGSPVSRRGP